MLRGVPGERNIANHARVWPQFSCFMHRHMASTTIDLPGLSFAVT